MANFMNAEHTNGMPLMRGLLTQRPSWIQRILHPSGVATRKKNVVAWVLVFASYLLTAQIGLYLFHDIGTSPALIWPPVGIALAAVLLEGYWIGSAIAAGAFLNAILSGAPAFIVIGSVLANTVQPIIGGLLLRKLRFNSLLNTLRDVFLLMTVAFTVTAISPLINYTFAQMYNFVAVNDRPLPPWPEIWMGGALSALVLTPFLSRWIGHDLALRTRLQQMELIVSIGAVSILSYVIFVTAVPVYLSTTLLLLLLGSLFWIAFRVGPRVMSLALLIMTSISLAGAIYGVHAPSQTTQTLSSRLISSEMFDLIMAFFFFILVSVEEQRKEAIKTLSLDAERLEKVLETIRAEDRAKNDFIATLAHELRNPLAPVMSGLELLRLGEEDPERIEILESAQRQSFMMRKLLDELLDVARITRRSLVLKKEEVLMQDILKQAIESVVYFYKERDQVFSTLIPPEEMWVSGDKIRLVQIFTNVLYNAGKYTELGGTITLTLENKNGSCIVHIADSGIGIPKDMLERVFEPFVQDSKSDEVGSGLGIGLSIAKRLVEMHEGTIVAKSEGKNRGSVFSIELPLLSRQVAKNKSITVPEALPSSILVVDDNRDAAKSIARLLRARGNTVDVVYSGKDALEAIAKKPKYVLLDIGLPDMEGHIVAKEIRIREPNAIVIALSGYGSREDKRKALEAGAVVHLTKPASLTDIEAALVGNK